MKLSTHNIKIKFLAFVLISVVISSCSLFRGSVSLEAAIVYKMGGSQPIAREKFYLLDKDLEQIIKEAGETEDIKLVFNGNGKTETYKRPFNVDDIKFPTSHEKQFLELQPIIAKHAKYTLETDFQGKAQLGNVEKGTYYVYGSSETRSGNAVWNLRIDVGMSENKITLDQNNALFAY